MDMNLCKSWRQWPETLGVHGVAKCQTWLNNWTSAKRIGSLTILLFSLFLILFSFCFLSDEGNPTVLSSSLLIPSSTSLLLNPSVESFKSVAVFFNLWFLCGTFLKTVFFLFIKFLLCSCLVLLTLANVFITISLNSASGKSLPLTM